MLFRYPKRRTISVCLFLLFCVGLTAAVPGAARAQESGYLDQFSYYVYCADREGLIPPFSGSLDDPLSESDTIDFIFQFLQAKCEVASDSYLSRARGSNATEERAKVAAINELLAADFWSISDDGELDNPVNIGVFISALQYAASRYIAPFTPLFYQPEEDWPLTRYNFQTMTKAVYHEDVLLGLMSEIIGLSQGRQRAVFGIDDRLTRRQAAAFCHMFSSMSLPKDRSGRYPGGLSGDAQADAFIAGILDKVITSGMTDEQKVKAIYDYLIYNFEHDDSSNVTVFRGFDGRLNPLADTVILNTALMTSGRGVCDDFANTLRLLAIRLGYECNYVSGQYVNRDGSKNGHGWNQIKVNGEWYWLDVDVEGTVFRNGNYSAPLYYLFMKKDSDWVSNHQWDRANWPAADDTNYPLELPQTGGPASAAPASTAPATTAPASAASSSAAPSSVAPASIAPEPGVITMTLDHERVTADTPPFIENGRTMTPIRFISEALGAAVEWNGETRLVAITAKDGALIKLTVGDLRMIIEKDGQSRTVTMDAPAAIESGRAYIPVRFVAEALGLQVEWDEAARTVAFTTQ